MATKKQRRRRVKESRHEYVYVDDEGNEVEVAKPKAAKVERKPADGKRPARAGREIKPPSWSRAVKWGVGFAVAMPLLLTITGGKKHMEVTSLAFLSVMYGAAFIPLTYFIHRMQYRTYQRMVERQKR
jgi:hypothetical protein